MKKILIANRGEIAIRIARAATDMGLATVAVHSADDAASLHLRMATEAVALEWAGPAAYLDIAGLIAAAEATGADAIHPGYGFLAERADFARACAGADLIFIGPKVEHLELFGDKARAREAAVAASVPVLRGIDRACSIEDVRAFFASLGDGAAVMIKALAGGGGRGTRMVLAANEIDSIFERCRSEAQAAFGIADLYVEEALPRARHIEVQILGDSKRNITHLGERECSVQRRFQKMIEIAPAPALDPDLRLRIIDAAVRFAKHVGYSSLGTFEFLVDASDRAGERSFAFIEANARLQVEHTVTEAVSGVDLVQSQISLAQGVSLETLGISSEGGSRPRSFAIQARVNAETILADGTVRPGVGVLTAYEAPSGPGVRTDGFGYVGYEMSSRFDSLLAKVIVHSPAPGFGSAIARLSRALSEFRLEGVATNIPFLRNILEHPDFIAGAVHTRWLDEHIATFARDTERQQRFVPFAADIAGRAAHDSHPRSEGGDPELTRPDGSIGVTAPMVGTVVAVDVGEGDEVRQGEQVAVIEAMKMEHVVTAPVSGIVSGVTARIGDVVIQTSPLLFILEAHVAGVAAVIVQELDLDHVRDDLRLNAERHALTQNESRQGAVAKRHRDGHKMPRENIARLVDPGSFTEYWPLIVARQHRRYSLDELRQKTPGDGLVAGLCNVNGSLFDEARSGAIVVHYDYTVLAGTQGSRNHYKQDRLFELAHRLRLPMILFGEGGGGRAGDDPVGPRTMMDTKTFTTYAKLSGWVPTIAIVNGRCFAGNTLLVGLSDVIIATAGTTLGMGGPAMIEGGGLGIYTPEEVGPMSFQVPNGVVDILVEDEFEAVDIAKKYLSYFQGKTSAWEANDQRKLRFAVPENRVRLYDMRELLRTLADKDSVLEIRPDFGLGIITAFARFEGRPMGVIANNPHHLSGAVDSDGSDKAARFMQLCDAFDIPILSLVDCPGIMVGPDAERSALVRHCARLFNVGANLTSPFFAVVVRKAYGLGAQAMLGASSLIGIFSVAWPTAEFAGMNIEGAIKLGYRSELAAIADPDARFAEFRRRADEAYDTARAVNAAMGGGIDDVIDPAETRSWIVSGLKHLPPVAPRTEKKYPRIDPW